MCYGLSIGHRIIHEIARFRIYFYCRNLANQYSSGRNKKCIWFKKITDSLSCLQALLYMNLEHPFIGIAIRKCVFLNIANKDIIFVGCLAMLVSRVSKRQIQLQSAQVGVPYTDFKHLINQYIFSTWQNYWNGALVNKLHSVKPVLGDWQSSYRRCRKDEVVLCRARIGH